MYAFPETSGGLPQPGIDQAEREAWGMAVTHLQPVAYAKVARCPRGRATEQKSVNSLLVHPNTPPTSSPGDLLTRWPV